MSFEPMYCCCAATVELPSRIFIMKEPSLLLCGEPGEICQPDALLARRANQRKPDVSESVASKNHRRIEGVCLPPNARRRNDDGRLFRQVAERELRHWVDEKCSGRLAQFRGCFNYLLKRGNAGRRMLRFVRCHVFGRPWPMPN